MERDENKSRENSCKTIEDKLTSHGIRTQKSITSTKQDFEYLTLVSVYLQIRLVLCRKTPLFKGLSWTLVISWTVFVFWFSISVKDGFNPLPTADQLTTFYGVSFGALIVAYSFMATTFRGIFVPPNAPIPSKKESRKLSRKFEGYFVFMNFALLFALFLLVVNVFLISLLVNYSSYSFFKITILWPLLPFIAVLFLVVVGLNSFTSGLGKLRAESSLSNSPRNN